MESQLRDVAASDDKPADFIRDPYPYFALKRKNADVFHGSVIDYSKTPESLRPRNSFAAVSFDAVNTAFRDGEVFSSTYYDNTIGLFIGPSILAMEGKSTANTATWSQRLSSPRRWRAGNRRSCGRSVMP